MYEVEPRAARNVFTRGYNFLRRMVHDACHGKNSRIFKMRDLFVLMVAYFIFDYGLRLGQSYEMTSSNYKIQSCLKVVRGEKVEP